MLSKIIDNITFENIFYYIFIIAFALFFINKTALNFNIIIYILIAIGGIFVWNYYKQQKQTEFIKKNEHINLDIDPIKYSKIYDIINDLEQIKLSNEYAYNEVIRNITLFFKTDEDKLKISYRNEILNNLTSITLTLPIKLDSYLYNIINEIRDELNSYIINLKDTEKLPILKSNKQFEIY
jgi:hypothetical protein